MGLRAIAPLNLSGIVLRGIAVEPAAAIALSDSHAPVSISLHFHPDGITNVYWLTQIPTLQSLTAGRHHVSAASLEALQLHPALTALSVAALTADALHGLAASPSLRSISVVDVSGDTAEAFVALAHNTTLRSLDIGTVTRAEDVTALARSRTVSALKLGLSSGTASAIPALAGMPALEHLALRGSVNYLNIAAEDIAAVCAMPLRSLAFSTVEIDAAAYTHLLSTDAKSLTLASGRALTDAEAALLAANTHLSSLSLGISMLSEAAALSLASAPALQYLEASYDSATPVVSKGLIAQAWLSAGKMPADLHVEIYPPDEEEEEVVPLWG